MLSKIKNIMRGIRQVDSLETMPLTHSDDSPSTSHGNYGSFGNFLRRKWSLSSFNHYHRHHHQVNCLSQKTACSNNLQHVLLRKARKEKQYEKKTSFSFQLPSYTFDM